MQIAQAYEAGGAACLSVLTDAKYFQGSFEYLQAIRAAGVATPLLCKEFIVEAYQLFKARANGADAVLLIAAVLPNADLAYLVKAAAKGRLQVLLEVHSIAGAACPSRWICLKRVCSLTYSMPLTSVGVLPPESLLSFRILGAYSKDTADGCSCLLYPA